MWSKIYPTCPDSKHKMLLNGALDTVWMEGGSDEAAYKGSTYREPSPSMMATFIQVVSDDIWDSEFELANFIKSPEASLVRRLGFPNGFNPLGNEMFRSIFHEVVRELNSRIDGNLLLGVYFRQNADE